MPGQRHRGAGDYRCKLIDFGAAIEPPPRPGGSAPPPHTRARHYLAPEQRAGAVIDYAGDIYALGAMMYEMPGRELPFAADSLVPEAAMQAQGQPLRLRLRKGANHCPPALEAIIHRCLEQRSADRFASAAELVRALDTLSI